jgi:hypothetical protein
MAGAISQPRQGRQFLFCLMKNPLLYRSAWPESSREASERFLMETLGRNGLHRSDLAFVWANLLLATAAELPTKDLTSCPLGN